MGVENQIKIAPCRKKPKGGSLGLPSTFENLENFGLVRSHVPLPLKPRHPNRKSALTPGPSVSEADLNKLIELLREICRLAGLKVSQCCSRILFFEKCRLKHVEKSKANERIRTFIENSKLSRTFIENESGIF